MKKVIIIASWLFVGLLLFVVLNTKIVTSSASFDLTEKERIVLEKRVGSKRDIEAAYRLAAYYYRIKGDMETEMFWYGKAVELGDDNAAHKVKELERAIKMQREYYERRETKTIE